MPVLSAANVVQAKTATVSNNATAAVTLDNPTTAGGTVTVEMYGPALWPGMPDGWEFDNATSPAQLWTFRYSGGPGGETSWSWTDIGPRNWAWRVTEWDMMLEPFSPYEAGGNNTDSGSAVTTLSTGTTNTTNRAEVVALATHVWSYALSDNSRTMTWDSYTNGFAERDELRQSFTPLTQEMSAAWSWLFADTTGAFESTATVTKSASNASDTYYGLVTVYAATVPEVESSPTLIVTS